ncbi:MAG: LPS export ABC transporter ATP-binding protein [Candidatus Eutrophobiaceae bacterium]
MSQLIVRHLKKSFRHHTAVHDISLEVRSGEIVSLLGPNGAGKTTSFYMIVGLIPCDSGEISIDGQSINHLPIHKRAHLGLAYLPQEESIFRKLTVEENLLAILQTRPNLNAKDIKERLETLLAEFRITHLRHSMGYNLSGGERRRVEIARALTTEPRFLLLDEPFAGVDPVSVESTRQLIGKLAQYGLGVLITDHNVRETLSLCDRSYIAHDGRIISQGTAEEILQHKEVRKVYLGEKFQL